MPLIICLPAHSIMQSEPDTVVSLLGQESQS
jgi:hypothetical protein